ncbi:MAG: YraN family protein [Actinomycetaceae bacterium]|nr:YraN family protein [Actinomycetaceae bacterium]
MARTHRLGQLGEEMASDFLTDRGYQILDRNYRRRGAEIDIVARDPKRGIVFVEVKTRAGQFAASAWESITPAKVDVLRRGAAVWLQENGVRGSVHLDAIVVKVKGRSASIEHRRGIV